MSKNTTTAINTFLGEIKNKKPNMVTASIMDGIIQRLAEKNTITPKQAAWILDKHKKFNMPMPKSLIDEIVNVMEKGGTKDQQIAEESVRKVLESDRIDERVEHFNNLFDMPEIKRLVDEVDDRVQQLKKKIK
jgi:transcriptional regulator CtsR